MREILFRGKTLISGRWIDGDLRQWSSGNVGICDRATNWTYKVDPDTIGQYTGLKDKDGKPIFEGDIIKGFNAFHRRKERYIVCYKVIGFFFCEYENEWHSDHIEEIEVIGNIHDKPELLEVRHAE